MVDRLCHKSYLVNMTGTSYRIKEAKKKLLFQTFYLTYSL